jgi:hypothetical protein
MRSSPGVSRRFAGFAMLSSGLGAQYHPSALMTDTLTDALREAHVLIVPIRWDQLPCLDFGAPRFVVRQVIDQSLAAGCGDFGPWAWDNSRCYTKLVLRNVAQIQIIAWPLLHSKRRSGRRPRD